MMYTYLETHTIEDIIQKDELLKPMIALCVEEKEKILTKQREKYMERYRKKKH